MSTTKGKIILAISIIIILVGVLILTFFFLEGSKNKATNSVKTLETKKTIATDLPLAENQKIISPAERNNLGIPANDNVRAVRRDASGNITEYEYVATSTINNATNQ